MKSKCKPVAAAATALVILAACGTSTANVDTTARPTTPQPAHRPARGTTQPASGTATTTVSTSPAPTSPAPTSPAPTSPAPTSPAPTSSGYANVNRSSPSAVAVATIEATFTSNTTKDTTPQDAIRRSAIWYTPAAATKLLAEQATGPVGAQWLAWTAHRAVTTVAVTPNSDPGAPPDTPTVAYRQYAVHVTPHGAGGWTTPPALYVCFVTSTRANPAGPWQVATLQTDQ